MLTITKEFNFCAAHRLFGYQGKCANLHGHNYRARVTVTSEELDDLGMIVDFGCIKKHIGGWIDQNWDHALLYNSEDEQMNTVRAILGKKVYVFSDLNPTAEVMAEQLFLECVRLMSDLVRIVCVSVEEAPGALAHYSIG